MAYSTFATSKWHVFRGENDTLPLMERKELKNSMLIVHGLRTFSYEEIKMRGVDACISDIKKVIKDGQFGKVYREAFQEVDDQYFTDGDYGMLASYFDSFMKEIYEPMHPKINTETGVFTAPSTEERKAQLVKKQIDLNKQIHDMQAELEQSKLETSKLDLETMNADIEGDVKYSNALKVPSKT